MVLVSDETTSGSDYSLSSNPSYATLQPTASQNEQPSASTSTAPAPAPAPYLVHTITRQHT
jgi:hypothetical protein